MLNLADSESTRRVLPSSRVTALFPGAFRPPHRAHMAAVLSLVARPDVTEVVVIISNRSRQLPGVTKVMDAETAYRVWSIYLENIGKVRIEIAPHAAVEHALDYFNHVDRGDTLLFCIGESDLASGDERFERIEKLSQQAGVAVEIASAPTGHMQVRATDLRAMLAQGDAMQPAFMAALPETLTTAQCERVWQACVDGLKEVDQLTLIKVQSVLMEKTPLQIRELTIARRNKIDPVLLARTFDNSTFYIKYAGDTVEGDITTGKERKPRRRLSVEKRALSRIAEYDLAQIGTLPVELPHVLYFDKTTRTMVQQAVCSGGSSLQDELCGGRFDAQLASQVAAFMANCHTAPPSIRPLWGDDEADGRHWQSMLALRINSVQAAESSCHRQLAQLMQQSIQAQRRGFFHLDLMPKNIRTNLSSQLGVIDFELSSVVGDPAYELGTLLGHYLFWGVQTQSQTECRAATKQLLQTYRRRVNATYWTEMYARSAAFAGATMLNMVHLASPQLRQHILAAGRKLFVSNLAFSCHKQQK